MFLPYYQVIIIHAVDIYRIFGFKAALYSHFLVMWFFVHLIVSIVVILATALLTLDERRILADIQLRRGPSKVGYYGFLQQFADAFKLLLKEFVTPRQLQENMFLYAGIISFILSTFFWVFLPFTLDNGIDTFRLNILFIFLTGVLHAYTIITAGWASNSKYSFLGGVRVSAQLISYDVPNVLVYINLGIYTRELESLKFLEFQVDNGLNLNLFAVHLVVFMISNLAESSRHPFDLTEAEAELVSGFNVEYSSIRFALFFLAEYSSVIFLSIFITNIFLYKYYTKFNSFEWGLKVFLIIFLIIYIRGLIPRYRFDQLMKLSWGCLIPLELTSLIFNLYLSSLI